MAESVDLKKPVCFECGDEIDGRIDVFALCFCSFTCSLNWAKWAVKKGKVKVKKVGVSRRG